MDDAGLALLLGQVSETLLSGREKESRAAFRTAAALAWRSAGATPFLPDRLPEGTALEVKGWTSGLALLLQARRDSVGARQA